MFGFLIVEDDSQIRNSLCRDFNWDSWGFRLLGIASNGKAALEIYAVISSGVSAVTSAPVASS